MTDPRLTPSLEETGNVQRLPFVIDASTITYSATAAYGSAAVGKAVKLTGTGLVIALTTDASAVLGKLLSVEPDGVATVQVEGPMTLPAGNSASITPGKAIVGAVNAQSAGGYIRECGAQAAEYVLARGFIVDDAESTAVLVYL